MKVNSLSKVTKLFLDLMFYVGIVITITVPMIFYYLGDYYPNIGNNYIPMCILFMLSGVLALVIVFHLRKMFVTVIKEDCFVEENVICLNRMGIASFMIAIVTAIRLIFVITPATLVIIIVFFIAGLFSMVLAQVFEQAVAYKLENDFTI